MIELIRYTVIQFLARKRDLASQCNLEGMKTKDIKVMELVRQINIQGLRTKFLEVKNLDVPTFLQIASDLQRARDVKKTLEGDAKATTSYKKGKDESTKEVQG